MKGEIVEHIFSPRKEDDWVLLKTDGGTYSLRYGGYKQEDGHQLINYEEKHCPFKGQKIKEVYSDDHWMFVLMERDGVISAGEVGISFAGETKLGVQFEKVSDFDRGFFDSDDLFTLSTGSDGWSNKR